MCAPVQPISRYGLAVTSSHCTVSTCLFFYAAPLSSFSNLFNSLPLFFPDRYLNLPSSNPPHLSSHHSSDPLGPPQPKRAAPSLLHSSPASFGPGPLPQPAPPPQEQHIPPFHGYPHRRSLPPAQEALLLRGAGGSGVGALPLRGDADEDDVDVSSSPATSIPSRDGGGVVIPAASSLVAAAAEAMVEGGDPDSPTPCLFEDGRRVPERRSAGIPESMRSAGEGSVA